MGNLQSLQTATVENTLLSAEAKAEEEEEEDDLSQETPRADQNHDEDTDFDDFQTPTTSSTTGTVEEEEEDERRATIRAQSRLVHDNLDFDLDSRRSSSSRQTLLLQQEDSSSEPEEEAPSPPDPPAQGERQEVLIQPQEPEAHDDDGEVTLWNQNNNRLFACTTEVEIWCFKYGVMAFAMKGQYDAAVKLRKRFRRLFVRPRGGSVNLLCPGCNRVLHSRPLHMWHSQHPNCAEDTPLGESNGTVAMLHFLQPFAIEVITRTTFQKNQRLDLLDPNLPTNRNGYHLCEWTATVEKQKENSFKMWIENHRTLGRVIRTKYEWYRQQMWAGRVPRGHRRTVQRSDCYHFPFVKSFENWTQEEKDVSVPYYPR
eukprot:scaffold2720_cov123-Cylindrotheca_fusiformis.AAC.3